MADTTHNATGAAPTAAVLASQLPLGELAPSSDVDSERHAHLAATDSSVPASTNEDQPSTIDAVHRAPVASSPTSNSSLTASGGTPITSTLTDRVLASQTTRSAESMDEKVTSRMNEEKQEDIVDKQTGRGKDGKAKRKKGDKEKPKVDKRSPLEIAMEDPELANLSDEHRRVIAEQIQVVKRPPATFTQLFRYSTSFELVLNFIGLICAVAAGAAQPVMTIAFGNLTTAFTQYATISQVASSSPEAIAAARSHLYSEVNKDVLILVYIGIGSFVATFIYMGTWVYTGETTTRRIREKYLRAVLRQNVAFFDKMGPGEITTRIETDTHLIQEGISDKVPMSLFFLGAFFTGFIVAIVRNWRLALVISTIIPCIAIAGGAMNKFISDYKTRQLAATARGATLAEEVISSVRSAHAFGTQNKLADLYDEANQETENLGQKSARFNGLGLGVFFFIIYCSYALAFFYGTTLILQGRANAGQIVNVFFSILIGAFSLAMLAPNLQSMSSAQGAATEIFATIDREPVIDSASPAGLKPETVEGTIELTNVDFIYPSRPAVQVLYGFSGTFPHGKMTALVGGSGSGKSTIIGLMERFYDPVSGSITLDGVELRELNVKWLRNQIGLVSQEPTLFATTVAGNIEHGLIGSRFENESPEDRRRRVVEAAKQSNAHGFIEALPQGYDTQIGERGMLLSGGQKQRIAIARAIVSDPAILLLDEATSALDTASEAIVQDALDRASTGRTTICIAHRLSTIKDADQIIVLTAGHILESAMSNADGSAHELLLRNPDGPYSKLVNAQKFREDTEGPTSSSSSITDGDEKAPVPGELTRAQLDEMAANEKPQFETVKRIGTGRSAASEALERQQNDLEAGGSEGPVQHNFPYLLFRMFKLNGRETTPHYVLAFAAAVLTGCVYPVFVFGGVLGVFSETDRDALRSGGNRYALYCFIIAIVATIGVIVQTWLFGATAERLAARLRLNTFKSILRQDIAYFDRDENSTGHLTATTSDLAQKILGLMGVTQGTIVQSIFTLIAGSIIGLSYAWRVALVGIACIPLTLSAGVIRLKVVVLKDQKNKRSHEQSAQMACEAASAIRTVASLTREEDCSAIYSEYLDKPMQESNRVAIWSSALYAISQSLSFWVIGLIFWYGAHQLASGAISSRQFFVAMISVVFGSIQAGNVFSFVPDMSNARGAAADFVRLVDSTPDIDAEDTSGNQFDLAASQGHIRFENCHFRYPTRPHVPVLRGLHLEVKPGQFAAIVGPSGCGKSTTIQLIERFYDPLAGHVIVDGQDISNLNVQSYRRAISLVSQEPTLYAGTIRFNITLGAHVPAEQVTQEEVERACKQANIHDFVMSLPDGYDTQVGGKGAQLSGGQKQRIAIARALVRDPKILLLDEATSALDSESEKVVQTALDQAAKNRTTIAIAHRLSSIQNADVIFVLKDGKVAERGTHFELLAKKGIYFELVAQQSLEKTQ
ncbi:hypothetical protein JCM1841_005277 [Sporobolomyces salmonicolor]